MTMHRHLPALAGAIALALGAAGAAASQEQGPPPPQGGPGAHQGWRGDPAAMKQRFEARRAEHAKILHDALSIRPDQEASFQAFMAAMAPQPHEHGQGERHEMGQGQRLTTPERLDHMSARMSEHQAAFQRRAEAIKAFYASLSPEQQRTFDALGAMRHGGMEGHGRMSGHGGWQGRGGHPGGEGGEG